MGQTEIFSLRLREARERKKLTQKQLADMAEITAASVSAYEKIDGTKSPSIDIAVKLAKALGVSLDWLAGLPDDIASNTKDALDIQNVERPLGEYLRMLILLSGLGNLRIAQESHEDAYCTIIALDDLPIEFEEFSAGAIKLQELLKDGVITKAQYADWLKGQLDRYECFSVKHNKEKLIVEDDDIPF
jgi:transcriptional regulator with XRE-family HTH domain